MRAAMLKMANEQPNVKCVSSRDGKMLRSMADRQRQTKIT